MGGKGESADRAENRPRSTIVPAKFPGYIEPGDVQNAITTPMFGGNIYENSCNVSTTLWSPDPESFSGLRKRKSDCAPEYAPRARSPIGQITHRHSLCLCLPLRSNSSERLFAGVRRGNHRTDKVGRISLCECDDRADEPIGLKVDNSGKFTTSISGVILFNYFVT